MAEKKEKSILEAALVRTWEENIRRAKKAKSRTRFIKDGDEIRTYYNGPHEQLFLDAEGWHSFEASAQVTINKTAQYVRVFGPSLYAKNPTRTVTPKRDNTYCVVLSEVQSDYLNYTPDETNLRDEARMMVDEYLIDGMGVLATEIDEEPGLVVSRYESNRNIEVDPDCTRMRDAYWMARKRRMPLWEVKELYGDRAEGLKPDERKSTKKEKRSNAGEGESEGSTSEMVTCWEIWSKMGVGFRSKAAQSFDLEEEDAVKEYSDDDDYKYMVIAFGHDKPLHVGKWPIPFFHDGTWPFTFLYTLILPDEPWPVAPLKPALGIQKALDFLASFFIEKAKNHSKNIVGVEEDVYDELRAVMAEGSDLPVVRFRPSMDGKGLAQRIQWIDPPPLGNDLREALVLLERLFEEQTGLTDVLLATTRTAYRSAEEARMKDRNSRATLDDMADEVEFVMTQAARKEALTALYQISPEEVSVVVGRDKIYAHAVEISYYGRPMPADVAVKWHPMAAKYYMSPEEAEEAAAEVQAALPMQMDPGFAVGVVEVGAEKSWGDIIALNEPAELAREFHYRIEAGSARRPNKNWEIDLAKIYWDQVVQMSYEMGDIESAHSAMDAYYDSLGVPQSQRVFPTPQEPPPEEAPMPEGVV